MLGSVISIGKLLSSVCYCHVGIARSPQNSFLVQPLGPDILIQHLGDQRFGTSSVYPQAFCCLEARGVAWVTPCPTGDRNLGLNNPQRLRDWGNAPLVLGGELCGEWLFPIISNFSPQEAEYCRSGGCMRPRKAMKDRCRHLWKELQQNVT